MSIQIDTTDTGEVFVNDKRLYQDNNGNWLADEELTPSERMAFNSFLKTWGYR